MDAITLSAISQTGRFDVLDCGKFKVHVYYSNDVMGDASFIIEGEESLVLMEMPLFKIGEAEFNAYIKTLGKKIETVITDYHLGGSGEAVITMPQGMSAFINGPIYGGMMKEFQKNWGETMVALPKGKTVEIPFGKTVVLAGIGFNFEKGASSDFPGASLNIGGEVYYTHWAFSKTHMSPLQLSSLSAIDAEMVATQTALHSGCKYYIGGHGGCSSKEEVEFRLDYLKTVKTLVEKNTNREAFIAAMNSVYPDLPGDINALSAVLYKN